MTSKATINTVLELLAEQFPKTFWIHEARRLPLKIGIREDLVAVLDGAVSNKELKKALRVYTANKVYRSRLIAGATRIDLAGEVAGVVAPEHAVSEPPKPLPISKAAAAIRAKGPKRLSLADLRTAARQRAAGGRS